MQQVLHGPFRADVAGAKEQRELSWFGSDALAALTATCTGGFGTHYRAGVSAATRTNAEDCSGARRGRIPSLQ